LALKIEALIFIHNIKLPKLFFLIFTIVYLALFEYFRGVSPNPLLRFTIAYIPFIFQLAAISYLLHLIDLKQNLKSLKWLFWSFAVAAILNAIKLVIVWLGYAKPDISNVGVDVFLSLASATSLAVVGNFAYVMLHLERAVIISENVLLNKVKLLERQRSIGLMANSFAHELSQPLTSITLDLYSVKTSIESKGIQKEQLLKHVHEMEKTVEHAIELIQRIRNYIRPKFKSFETEDLIELIREASTIMSHDIRKNSVAVVYELPSELLVSCDKVEVSQIFLNVIRNAIQAMEFATEKVLTISAKKINNNVVLTFKDTGTGISSEVLGQLGNPFFTTKEEGLGIGLSISNSIAEKHNGTLVIKNAVGGGAEVTLCLPLLD
jgi:signal transduction histidine kinase